MSLELVGDYVWGRRISWPPGWDSQLQGPFPNLRAGAALLMFAPCSPPPPQENENGGDSQSNSVSESPSSPGLLAVSPDSGETHSEVRLGMLGGGSGWKSGVWAEPPLWGCPGGAQWG